MSSTPVSTVTGGLSTGELVLAAAVARRHYLDSESKVELAEHFGISRFKVARLLDFARESGIVQISIATVGQLDLDLSARLESRYPLRHVVVVAPAPHDHHTLPQQLGEAAADLISETLRDDDVLGLPWSRSVDAMTLALKEVAHIEVVQLSGALELEGHNSSAVDMVRRVARLARGSSSIFYAPMLLDSARAATALRREPAVAAGLAAAERVTHAVVGVGGWAPGASTIHDAAKPADRAAAARAGVVGEIAGVFFDAAGHVVELPLAKRVVTVAPAALSGIGEVVAVASGAGKAAAVHAAISGGLVHSLVCDREMAVALLA